MNTTSHSLGVATVRQLTNEFFYQEKREKDRERQSYFANRANPKHTKQDYY